MLRRGAAIAPALTFFAEAGRFRETAVWSHRDALPPHHPGGRLFRRLGVERGEAFAFILPNLPETPLAIWGGEEAGITFVISL